MIRVLLVDDQPMIRHGLRQLLATEPEMDVVGEAADGNAALALLASGTQADVALVDARMPGMDGLTLIARLTSEHPQIACLLLTTFDDDELVVSALRAGAAGFLLKDVEPEDLVQAVRGVLHRTMVLDEQVVERLVARLQQPQPQASPAVEVLNSRELEVARLIGQGMSNREISANLFLAEGTVKNTVTAILRKMDVRDRTQLAIALRDL